MTPCAHNHSTSSGVLWPARLSHTRNSRSGGAPVAVEAAHPGGDGLIVPSSNLVGCRRVGCAIRNGQERSSALDLCGGSTERAAQAGQLLALIRRERAKRICLVARHGTPRGTRIASPLYQTSQQVTH